MEWKHDIKKWRTENKSSKQRKMSISALYIYLWCEKGEEKKKKKSWSRSFSVLVFMSHHHIREIYVYTNNSIWCQGERKVCHENSKTRSMRGRKSRAAGWFNLDHFVQKSIIHFERKSGNAIKTFETHKLYKEGELLCRQHPLIPLLADS